MREGAARCDNCGAVYGEANRCPHCRTIADVRQKKGHFVCVVCGAPRLPLVDPHIGHSEQLVRQLREAQRLSKKRWWRRLGGGLLAFMGVAGAGLSLLIALIAGIGVGTAITAGLTAILPLAIAVALFRSAAKLGGESDEVIEQAWLELAGDVVDQREAVTAASLGELLGVSASRAEDLLVRLNALGRVRSRISEEGQLLYTSGGAKARFRVEEGEQLSPEEAEARANEEAAAWVEEQQRLRARRS